MRVHLDKTWRLHPTIRWMIFAGVVLAQLVLLLAPKSWELTRMLSLGANMFLGGIFVASELALWERASPTDKLASANTEQNEG